MYQAKIDNKNFDVIPTEEGYQINGQLFQWDLVQVTDGYFHILHDHASYRAEVVKMDTATKTFTFKINGTNYSVALKDKFDILLEKMGMAAGTGAKINNIKAPMPGLIIDLKIKTGDAVKAGDPLLVLEAMKMENILKAPGDAVVKNVKVKKGDSVEKGQILIEF